MSSSSALSSAPASRDNHQFTLNTGSRPYRSHKIRACDLCRKRKSRCTVDLPGQSCLLCRVQGADCHYAEDKSVQMEPPARSVNNESKAWNVPTGPQGQKRKYNEIAAETPLQNVISAPPRSSKGYPSSTSQKATQNDYQSQHELDGSLNQSMHIVGPVAAADAQVIERLMPSEKSMESQDRKAPYNVYSNDPRKPILYTTVSRRRQGLRTTGIPGETQKEIIEQILGPFKHDLVNMYVL